MNPLVALLTLAAGAAHAQMCTCLGIAGDASVPMCSAAECSARAQNQARNDLSPGALSHSGGATCGPMSSTGQPCGPTGPVPPPTSNPPPSSGSTPPSGGNPSGGGHPSSGGTPSGGATPSGGGNPSGGSAVASGPNGVLAGSGKTPAAPGKPGGGSLGGDQPPSRPSDRDARMAGGSTALPGQLEKVLPSGAASSGRSAPVNAEPARKTPVVLAGAIAGPGGAPNGPSLARGYARSLDTKFKLRDFKGALDDAGKMIDLAPKDSTGYTKRAEVYNELEQYSQAEKDALEAVKLNPADAAAWEALAWAQLKEGKYQQAKDAATLAIEIDPNDARAYLLRAYAEEMLGDHEAAMRDLAKAAALDPRLAPKLAQAQAGGKLYEASARSPLVVEVPAAPALMPGWAAAALVGTSALALGFGAALWMRRRKPSPVGRLDLTQGP